ncbi:hypothetical protein SV7mr_34100 [Stieleria bergensis]|uniref:Sulfatase n=1 Tax=Stieleria bergensis TaxID=2528025 RepID=A0A517SXW7_9BACT|nr:hypothetical protein SV7mr_34100 [Planctomycetes bacterium SV_7m_r]
MNDLLHTLRTTPATRRNFLRRSGMGFGSLALASLFGNESAPLANAAGVNPMAAKQPHFPGKAKAVIHIFLNGGPSHVDTFDPKPALEKFHGKSIPVNLRTERETGAAYQSPFKFKKYGQSGIEVSELFSHVGEMIDDVCVVRSMHANVPNHEPSLMLMNCGQAQFVRPSVGSWITYGLGSENQNLPGFISMCPGGYPIKGAENWQAGFLPGAYQGTSINTQHQQIEKLISHIRNAAGLGKKEQRQQLDLLQTLNRQHQEQRQQDAELEARVQSFELAYRMQMEASDAFDINQEPESIRNLYGDSVQSRQILIARRLVERGVRYIQLWHGAGQPWDSHDQIEKNHKRLAGECSQAIGALLKDLKQRSLLDDTLVIWGGEFGRTPTVELPKPGANAGSNSGRDHNHHGFTMWLAGGGVKGGHVHGATDEFGFQAVENRVHVHDLHATILHLLGFDHERLTYRYAGRDFRLTDVHGNVVHDLIA